MASQAFFVHNILHESFNKDSCSRGHGWNVFRVLIGLILTLCRAWTSCPAVYVKSVLDIIRQPYIWICVELRCLTSVHRGQSSPQLLRDALLIVPMTGLKLRTLGDIRVYKKRV
jgi:hypothetical protein